MTGIGIATALTTFLITCIVLCKRYNLQFWKLFYRLPGSMILIYLLGSYTHFALNKSIVPTTISDIMTILSPYWYNFHFIGIIIGITIAFRLFLRKTKRIENRKLYIDVLFFCSIAALIPLWIFLLLWDDFIGRVTSSSRWVQALHPDSTLNKFSGVYPIGLFLSIGATIVGLFTRIRRKISKKNGLWLWGFALLIFVMNSIFIYQQYPRYGVVSIGNIVLDIKQYISLIIILLCIYTYDQRDNE